MDTLYSLTPLGLDLYRRFQAATRERVLPEGRTIPDEQVDSMMRVACSLTGQHRLTEPMLALDIIVALAENGSMPFTQLAKYLWDEELQGPAPRPYRVVDVSQSVADLYYANLVGDGFVGP